MTETTKQFRQRVRPGDQVIFYYLGVWRHGIVHLVPAERFVHSKCEIIFMNRNVVRIMQATIGDMGRPSDFGENDES